MFTYPGGPGGSCGIGTPTFALPEEEEEEEEEEEGPLAFTAAAAVAAWQQP
jgi:hypothetical protein